MLRAVCLILCILIAEKMAWLTKQCMDGGTVNRSLNTRDAVREGTDELGGCSDIPREKSSHALCVYIYMYVCAFVHVWTCVDMKERHFWPIYRGSLSLCWVRLDCSLYFQLWLYTHFLTEMALWENRCRQNSFKKCESRSFPLNTLKHWIFCTLLKESVGVSFSPS